MATTENFSTLKLESHSLVRVGDTVMLYYNAEKGSREEAINSGYIISDLSVTNNHSLILFPSELVNPDLPNIQFGTFKVLAENKYEAQARLDQEMRKYEATRIGRQDKDEDVPVAIVQARKDVVLEMNENKEKQKRLDGEPICYGDNVQLQHTLTRKYLATSTTETSRTEHTKLKANLQEQEGRSCIFKILPRYKIQSVGHEVQYSDQVKFESVATEGQFLHCSKKTFGDVKIKANKKCHELNLASTDSALTVVRHYQPSTAKKTDGVALKGGGTVRLYHKHKESYVVAKGSFAGVYANLAEIMGVHEMHPDFRISVSQQSLDEDVGTGIRSNNGQGETSQIAVDSRSGHQVQAGVEPVWTQESTLTLSGDEGDRSDHRAASRGGLDYYDTGKDLESRGVVDEDVHFQRKRSRNGAKKSSETSANTFWQVEKLCDPRSGEPVLWNEKCRIKHLPTRMYLAVTMTGNRFHTTLVSSKVENNQLTVFALLPVTHQDSNVVYHESLSRIKHCATDTWLHFNKDMTYHQKHGPDSTNWKRGQDSNGRTELFQLCAAKELFHDDAFVFEQVNAELVTNFNSVAGITTVLTNQIKECRLVSSWNEGPHHMHQHCNSLHTIGALRDLQDFMHEPRCPSKAKAKQKLLRNLKVVELIVYLVELHRDDSTNDPEICTPCFAAISKYLEGSSSKNKKYITPMAKILFSGTVWSTQLKDDHNVESLLINMVKNSPALLMEDFGFVCRVAKHIVDKLVQMHDILRVPKLRGVVDSLLQSHTRHQTPKFTDVVNQAVQKNGQMHNPVQGPTLLMALSVLCECNGVPIKRNQDKIYSYLREIYQDEKVIFYEIDVMQPTNQESEWFLSSPSSRPDQDVRIEMERGWIEMTDTSALVRYSSMERVDFIPQISTENRVKGSIQFRRKNHIFEPNTSGNKVEAQYLEAQLNLLAKMCLGDNSRVIKALQQNVIMSEHSDSIGIRVAFYHIMSALDSDLHPQIKTLFVELLQAMFIDVGKNRPFLDQLPFSFKLNEVKEVPFADTAVGERGNITALTKVQNEHFPRIKLWIEEYFKKRQSTVRTSAEEHAMLAQLLKLLSTLIKYGYYDDPEDIHEPLQHIIAILDEQKEAKAIKESVQDAAAMESYFRVKKRAMEVLDLLFNYQFYRVLHLFIYDFNQILHGTHSSKLKKVAELSDDATMWNQGYTFFCFSGSSSSKTPLACEYPRFVKAARERLKVLLSESKLNLISNSQLPRILLELAQYEDEELIQSSLQLLNKFYTFETTVLSSANQAQLLVTDASVSLHNMIEQRLLSSLQDYLDWKNIVVSESHRSVAGYPSPLRELTRHCWLEGEVEGCEPHQENQKIIYKFGVMSSVVDFIQQHSCKCITAQRSSLSRQRASGAEKRSRVVLIECFQFLRALAFQYKDIQLRLLQYVDLFLSAATGDVAPHVARLLREVFSGGPASSLRVTESQIKAVMAMVFLKSGSTISREGKVEFVRLLQELVLVRDLSLPVKHNQNLITKVFNHIRDDDRYWCKELLREGRMDERLNILKKEPDSSEELQILLLVTDLLASCAEGSNGNSESVCCTVFVIEEVLQVIVNPDVKLYRKIPYARFLVWAYLTVDQTKGSRRIITLANNKKLWKFMDNAATLLSKVCDALTGMSPKDYLLCKEYIMRQAWRFCHSEVMLGDAVPHSVSGINGPTTEDAVAVPDALLFLAEGFLPLLHVFYTKYFNLDSCSQSDPKRAISEKICDTILRFNEPFSSDRVYFSMEVQVKLYRRVMYVFRKLLSEDSLSLKVDFPYISKFQFEDVARTTGGRMSDVVLTKARREYNDYYTGEVELNEYFNNFVHNYTLAYQGPNTAKAQIGVKVKKSQASAYSHFRDAEMTRPGHHYLPLGPAFQEHVACFLNTITTAKSLPYKVSSQHGVIEQLLKQLEISASGCGQGVSEAASRRQVDLDVKCLQILRCMVYNNIVLIDPELKERNPEEYRRQCSSKLHPMQMTIQGFGNALARVLALLSSTSERVVYEVLAFLNVLLESGNTDVQNGLREVMDNKEHPMFHTFQRILKEAATAYTESQSMASAMKICIRSDEEIGLSWGKMTPRRFQTTRKVVQLFPQDSSLEDITAHQKRPTPSNMEPETMKLQEESAQARRPWQPARKATAVQVSDGEQKRVSFMSVYQHTNEIPGLNDALSGLIYFHDLSHIELIMKVLGLMCDGQYKEMQDFIRVQSEQMHGVDLLGEVTTFLQTFHKNQHLDSSTIKILHRMLQTLIEMSVGNHANQRTVFNRQILPVLNRILQVDISNIKPPAPGRWVNISQSLDSSHFDEGEDADLYPWYYQYAPQAIPPEAFTELKKQALELKGSAIELLEGMLEETSSKTKELVIRLSGGIDIDALHGTMVDFHRLKSDKELKKAEYDDNAERGLFRTYHILMQLQHYKVPLKLEPSPGSDAHKVWEECRRASKSVEVVYRNAEEEDIITIVHFKFDLNNMFRKELISRVKLQIKRNSAKDKLRDLVEWMGVVKKDTNHQKKLKESKYTLKPLVSFSNERYYILLFLTLLMNLLVLLNFELPLDLRSNSTAISVTVETSVNTTTLDHLEFLHPFRPDLRYPWFTYYLLYILGGIHLFFSIWMLLEYFLTNWPNFSLPKILYTNILVSTIRRGLEPTSADKESTSPFRALRTKLYRRISRPKRSYADVNIFGMATLYVLVFVASSALSLYLSGYFYCFCLFYIVVKNDVLQRTLKSITTNAKALLWVAAFILTVLFVYSVLSFAFLYRSFASSEDLIFCRTLAECFATVVRFQLLDELGLRIPVVPMVPEIAGIRLIFDISIFVLVSAIGLNIILGVIVDTFSELRGERSKTQQDMKSVCFICGLPCHRFEKELDHGFKEHVEKHHNMWAYIYYSLYLDQIDISDQNAIEKYIHGKMKEGVIDYFPINKALDLKDTNSDDERRLAELKTMMKAMMDKMWSMQEAIGKLSHQQT